MAELEVTETDSVKTLPVIPSESFLYLNASICKVGSSGTLWVWYEVIMITNIGAQSVFALDMKVHLVGARGWLFPMSSPKD